MLFITNLFADTDNRIQSVLLFYMNDDINTIKIINESSRIVDYEPLNKFLISNNAFKVEKWSKFASSNDVYNGIQFSRIYKNEEDEPRCTDHFSY